MHAKANKGLPRNGLQKTSTRATTIPFMRNYSSSRQWYIFPTSARSRGALLRGRSCPVNMSHLLERGASTAELNDMFERMDIDSEQIVACPAPETTSDVNITSDLTHIAGNAYKAGLHEKPGFGSGTWEKPPTSNWNSVRPETNRNPPSRVSRGRYDKQKRKVSFTR
jgi:hypothetical protein